MTVIDDLRKAGYPMHMAPVDLKIAMDKELLSSDQRPSREAVEDVGKAAKARRDQITAAETTQWLTDRLTNCIRLAALTRPEDRAGWVDDAAHFAAALNLLALAGQRGK